jgi:hypothetical protein
MQKNVTVSSPSVTGLDELYTIYKEQLENNKASYDDFITFLSAETPEREIFLDIYCETQYQDMGSTLILVVSPKK